MAFATWWEQTERQAVALYVAGLSAGADIPSPEQMWDEFNEQLNAPPRHLSMSRDELALRRALGVAS